jgi:hypothetical protein
MLPVWEPASHFTVGAEASLAGVAAFTAEASGGAVGAIRLSVLVGGQVGAWDSAGVGIPSGTGRRTGTTHGGTAIHQATFTRIHTSSESSSRTLAAKQNRRSSPPGLSVVYERQLYLTFLTASRRRSGFLCPSRSDMRRFAESDVDGIISGDTALLSCTLAA